MSSARQPDRGALRRQMAARLAAAGIETPDLDARILLAHALSIPAIALVSEAHAPVAAEAQAVIQVLMERRLGGEPVARILGFREFWSLTLSVTPATLEPRPDTETVVEAALAAIEDRTRALRLLDLGTGTGAILAALLSELPGAFGVALDLNPDAARAGRDNLARLGLASRSAVLVGDWAEALAGRFDLVVSNPPYIATARIADLDREVRDHDPWAALDGGADGLDAYRRLMAGLPHVLEGGATAVIELGQGQEPHVAQLARAVGLHVAGPARRDLGGVARALVLEMPSIRA